MIQRHIFAALTALFVTYGLIFLMSMLIASGKDVIDENKKLIVIDFVRVPEDESIREKSRKAKRPEKQRVPPKLPQQRIDNITSSKSDLNMGFNYKPAVNLGSADLSADGDYLPFYTVPPTYPQRAIARNIEGYVILQFTVTKLGTVKDAVVTEADPPNIFNRAAIKAVLKYKYKPRVVDGVPVEARGVKTRVFFEFSGSDE